MKKNTGNLFYFLSIVTLTALVGVCGYFYKAQVHQSKALGKIRNGSHICTSRVSQSFISFAAGSFSALSLEDRFLSTTDECFESIDSKTKSIATSFATLTTEMYDEFLQFKNLVRNTESRTSSVQKSFNKIDKLKYTLGVKLTKSIREIDTRKNILKIGFIGLLCLLGFVAITFLMVWRKFSRTLNEIEEEAKFIVDDLGANSARIERLVERVLNFANVPVLKNLYLDYQTYVNETRAYSIEGMNHQTVDFQGEAPALSTLEDDYVVKVFDLKKEEENLSEIESEVSSLDQEVKADKIELSDIVEKSEKVNSEQDTEVESEKDIVIHAKEKNEKSFKKSISEVTRAFLRNTPDSGLTWEFSSEYIDFSLMKNTEEFVHILHALVARYHKGFIDSDTDMNSRYIQVNKVIKDGDVVVEFSGKNLLFNTAELEYFNTSDPSFKKLVDINFIMLHKLAMSVNSDVEVQNTFTEDGERIAIIKIYLPLIFTNITREFSESESKGPKAKKSMLNRVLKGSKKQISKRLKKETTV